MTEPLEPTQLPAKPPEVCPTCGGELTPHGNANPHKAGAQHCNTCGSCWASDLTCLRPGGNGPLLTFTKPAN